MGFANDRKEWQHLIDSSNRSLKAMLLFNGNKMSSIPVGYSVQMTENYKNMELLLTALQYKADLWRPEDNFVNTGIKFHHENNILNSYNNLSLF